MWIVSEWMVVIMGRCVDERMGEEIVCYRFRGEVLGQSSSGYTCSPRRGVRVAIVSVISINIISSDYLFVSRLFEP